MTDFFNDTEGENVLMRDKTELEEYQDFVETCVKNYIPDYPLAYAALGLSGETGEVVERIKKIARKEEKWDDADVEYLTLELGDVLWYVARICNILDVSMDDVIMANIEKLKARHG